LVSFFESPSNFRFSFVRTVVTISFLSSVGYLRQKNLNNIVQWYAFKQCGGSGIFIPDPGSDFFPSRIQNPGSELTPSRIPDPPQRISNLIPKKPKKWFLSSKKYDPG
jgi:hypothetical protein